jgi:hypothetical protein
MAVLETNTSGYAAAENSGIKLAFQSRFTEFCGFKEVEI